jgi:cellobiose epimerase
MNDQNNSINKEKIWRQLSSQLNAEFDNILNYWVTHAVDKQGGGFFGRIDQDNNIDSGATRGSVLNARILWAFSAAYNHSQNPAYLDLATRAFQYIRLYITDPIHGGLYWSVNHDGSKGDDRKLIYAQAFGIYAMSEYYRITADEDALALALEWYRLIETISRDQESGGYIDAFSRDWSFLADKRLSEKDENATKTMNTHLHIVEAYANLYEVAPSGKLKSDIIELLNIFDEKIIRKEDHHLGLFFSKDWQMDSGIVSYGHDIEAAWLLLSCAESSGDPETVLKAKKNAVFITDAAMEGLDNDGGLWYEYHSKPDNFILEKHWWPQAEALIGFCNAWQLTGDMRYRDLLLKNWEFIKNNILDIKKGEWFWGVDGSGNPMPGQDKVGMWKCPYHNSRACLELIKRIELFFTF